MFSLKLRTVLEGLNFCLLYDFPWKIKISLKLQMTNILPYSAIIFYSADSYIWVIYIHFNLVRTIDRVKKKNTIKSWSNSYLHYTLQVRPDSNRRPPEWQSGILTNWTTHLYCSPSRTWTYDPLIKKMDQELNLNFPSSIFVNFSAIN